mgnify:FL=1|jgi:hypothetical protein|tara:strand:- start:2352 stop:2606 length:255 start_codon:yes stop_codon:yes gene_type:complete
MYDLGDTPEKNDSNRIDKLREGSKETMMNMIYNAVVDEEERALKSETDPGEKVLALTNILNFFLEIEEYEKCSNIKKIIDKIKC